jgi:hypothetical protein
MSDKYLVRQIVTIEYEQMVEAPNVSAVENFATNSDGSLSDITVWKLTHPESFAEIVHRKIEFEEIIEPQTPIEHGEK